MKTFWNDFAPRALTVLRALLLCSVAVGAFAGTADLRSKYIELREQLRHNGFQRPLHIESAENGDSLRGDVYAVLPHPFAEVEEALKNPSDWCDILILPFNAKYCRAVPGNGGANLVTRIGRRADQPVQQAYRVDFALQPVAAGADYFESRLAAAQGPFGTHDYRIDVSAVPLDAGRTFLHLSYSYATGAAGRFAMQAYLVTAGAHKVGFTLAGRDGNGQPIFIGGVRGAIERTAMRYYLAIDAELDARKVPPEQQLEKRLTTWFDAAERYPRQLHEMDRESYLTMKRGESGRQQALVE
jgi:hypothetical protein